MRWSAAAVARARHLCCAKLIFVVFFGSIQAIAQLSTLRVARSESLVCLEAMCSQKPSEKHFLRLLEHLPEMVQNVKQALAQVRPYRCRC